VLRLAKLLGKLLGKVFRNSSRAGWAVGDSTQHAHAQANIGTCSEVTLIAAGAMQVLTGLA
jgi:hypothetical protein